MWEVEDLLIEEDDIPEEDTEENIDDLV